MTSYACNVCAVRPEFLALRLKTQGRVDTSLLKMSVTSENSPTPSERLDLRFENVVIGFNRRLDSMRTELLGKIDELTIRLDRIEAQSLGLHIRLDNMRDELCRMDTAAGRHRRVAQRIAESVGPEVPSSAASRD